MSVTKIMWIAAASLSGYEYMCLLMPRAARMIISKTTPVLTMREYFLSLYTDITSIMGITKSDAMKVVEV